MSTEHCMYRLDSGPRSGKVCGRTVSDPKFSPCCCSGHLQKFYGNLVIRVNDASKNKINVEPRPNSDSFTIKELCAGSSKIITALETYRKMKSDDKVEAVHSVLLLMLKDFDTPSLQGYRELLEKAGGSVDSSGNIIIGEKIYTIKLEPAKSFVDELD